MKTRFQIGLAGILILFCLFAAAITYYYERSFYQLQVRDKTDLVMEVVEATRSYIRETLRPAMYVEVGADHFILEAMSTSYITRAVMQRFNDRLPGFIYRRAAVNARNPDFEATDYEQKMITYFREHPDEKKWFGLAEIEGEQCFVQFRPVIFTASCMHCHGGKTDAPAEIISRYGETGGFDKPSGLIGGVQSIRVAARHQLAAVRESAFQVFSLIAVIMLFLYAVIWIFFDWTVARNIRSVLGLFRDSLQDREGEKIFHLASRGDEVKKLEQTARRMADHLTRTRKELEQYNQHLEYMVAEQTRGLRNSKEKLKEQVAARNRELHLLNSISSLITCSMDRKDLLAAVLGEALRVVPAGGAGIYLPTGKGDGYRLHHQQGVKGLAGELDIAEGADEIIGSGCTAIKGSGVDDAGTRVPLCCRDKLQGILVFTGIRVEELDEAMQDLLLSIGRQIGITLESLESIDGLRRNKELLQTVFDAITDPMVMVDAEGRILMVNSAFLQRYQLAAEQVQGADLAQLSADNRLPYGPCFPAADSPLQHEVSLADGSEFSVISYPVVLQENEGGAMVCFARDITGQKEVDRRIRRTERLAALGHLAAGVAHEINNPLGVILCYAEILEKKKGDPGQREQDIRVIVRQARTCQRIVSDLLNFSRRHDSEYSLVHVQDIVSDVKRLLVRQLEQREISLSYRQEEDIAPCFMDRARMQQVLVNLIMNSVQAVEKNGEIAITASMDGEGRLVVQVRDNGCGISEDVLPRIFDPFFTTKDGEQGTGLGLSVSMGIVREHGGSLTVSSREGEGSCFTVILPLEGGLATGYLE